MKRRNGFTIVELVIVIAVIAILSAVLIPTFSGMIGKAHVTADVQTATGLSSQFTVYNGDLSSPAKVMEYIRSISEGGLVPKSAGQGYHYWYDIQNNRLVLAKATEKDGNTVLVDSNGDEHIYVEPVNVSAGGVAFYEPNRGVANSTFTHSDADPRCLIPGYVLVDAGGSEITDLFAAVDNIGLDTVGDYVAALDELPTRGDDKVYADLIRANGSTFLSDDGLIVIGEMANPYHVPGSNYPQNRDVYTFGTDGAAGATYNRDTDAAAWEGIMNGITEVHLNASADLLVTENSLYFTEAVTLYLSAEAGDLADHFAANSICVNTTVQLPDGTTYQLWKSASEQGTNSDNRTVIVQVDADGNVIGAPVAEAEPSPFVFSVEYEVADDAKAQLIANGNVLYVAEELGTVIFKVKALNQTIQYSNTNVEWTYEDSVVSMSAPAQEVVDGVTYYVYTLTMKELDFSNPETELTATAEAGGHQVAYKFCIVSTTLNKVVLGGEELSADDANIFLYEGNPVSLNFDLSSKRHTYAAMTGNLCDLTATYTTEGDIFTVSEDGVLTLNDGATEGQQDITVTVGPEADPYFTETYTVKFVDVSDSPYQKLLTNANFLYRVGNKNAIKLSDLISYTAPDEDVTVEAALAIVDAIYQTNAAPLNLVSVGNANRLSLTAQYPTALTAENHATTTLDFEGTGVCILRLTVTLSVEGEKVAEYPLTLALEVIDAYNVSPDDFASRNAAKLSAMGITSSTSTTTLKDFHDVAFAKSTRPTYTMKNANYVLLGDIKLSGTYPAAVGDALPVFTEEGISLTNATLFANGFTIDIKGLKHREGIIALNANAVLDNAVVLGSMFPGLSIAGNGEYNTAAILMQGEGATVQNSFISETRAPIRIHNTSATLPKMYVTNTVLYGGSYGNVDLRSGYLVLTNVTTINQARPLMNDAGQYIKADGTVASDAASADKIVGMGVVIMLDHRYASPVLKIEGTFNQYNWIAQSEASYMADGGLTIYEQKTLSGITLTVETTVNPKDCLAQLYTDSAYSSLWFGSNGSAWTSGEKWANAGVLHIDYVTGLIGIADKMTAFLDDPHAMLGIKNTPEFHVDGAGIPSDYTKKTGAIDIDIGADVTGLGTVLNSIAGPIIQGIANNGFDVKFTGFTNENTTAVGSDITNAIAYASSYSYQPTTQGTMGVQATYPAIDDKGASVRDPYAESAAGSHKIVVGVNPTDGLTYTLDVKDAITLFKYTGQSYTWNISLDNTQGVTVAGTALTFSEKGVYNVTVTVKDQYVFYANGEHANTTETYTYTLTVEVLDVLEPKLTAGITSSSVKKKDEATQVESSAGFLKKKMTYQHHYRAYVAFLNNLKIELGGSTVTIPADTVWTLTGANTGASSYTLTGTGTDFSMTVTVTTTDTALDWSVVQEGGVWYLVSHKYQEYTTASYGSIGGTPPADTCTMYTDTMTITYTMNGVTTQPVTLTVSASSATQP